MPEGNKPANAVSKSALVIAVVLSVALTAIIVGSIVFAWQNSASTEDDIFRQELLDTEGEGLEDQIELMNRKDQE